MHQVATSPPPAAALAYAVSAPPPVLWAEIAGTSSFVGGHMGCGWVVWVAKSLCVLRVASEAHLAIQTNELYKQNRSHAGRNMLRSKWSFFECLCIALALQIIISWDGSACSHHVCPQCLWSCDDGGSGESCAGLDLLLHYSAEPLGVACCYQIAWCSICTPTKFPWPSQGVCQVLLCAGGVHFAARLTSA
jgi:hypothetical protein